MLATAAVFSLSCFTHRQRGTAAQDHTPVIHTQAIPVGITLRNHEPGTGNYSPDMNGTHRETATVILTSKSPLIS